MSQSPTSPEVLDSARDYFRNWDALGLMIARGSSFSGDERNCVFLNTGGPRFADVSAAIALDFSSRLGMTSPGRDFSPCGSLLPS